MFIFYRGFFQDRLAPFTVDRDLNGVPLTAKLAEDEGALTLIKQPGADGFVIDTEPLFEVRIVQLLYILLIDLKSSTDYIGVLGFFYYRVTQTDFGSSTSFTIYSHQIP